MIGRCVANLTIIYFDNQTKHNLTFYLQRFQNKVHSEEHQYLGSSLTSNLGCIFISSDFLGVLVAAQYQTEDFNIS